MRSSATRLTEVPAKESKGRIVLERIEAYGLQDCLAIWRERGNLPPMSGCRCEDTPCRHTLTRLTPNTAGSDLPLDQRDPVQVDYLFASKAVANRLEEVIEIASSEWELYSDHSPIVVKFRRL